MLFVGQQTDGQEQQSNRKAARHGLILEGQHRRTDDRCAQREYARYQKRLDGWESQAQSDQVYPGDAADAKQDLLRLQNLPEAQSGQLVESHRRLVVNGERHMGILRQNLLLKNRWIGKTLEDRQVDLRVG